LRCCCLLLLPCFGCFSFFFFFTLCAEQNGVAGTLPFELSRLQNLRALLLEEGILTGTLPSQLGEVRTLEYVWKKKNFQNLL
jgi:hypothetical protein